MIIDYPQVMVTKNCEVSQIVVVLLLFDIVVDLLKSDNK